MRFYHLSSNPAQKVGTMGSEEHKEILFWTKEEYLHCVDEKCYQTMELLVQQMKVKQGVTGQMKAEEPMLWVGLMNNIRRSAEEFVMKEIVYS